MRESRRNMARRSSDSPISLPEKVIKAGPDYSREAILLETGARVIAGCDEAGRGPLAGPVVAAAVVLDLRAIPEGLNDSKILTADTREDLFAAIVVSSAVGVASASAAEIDRYNIRGATFLAMRRAVRALPLDPCHVLIDGRDVPPMLRIPASALVSGDALCLSIAAASIVAKVIRDRIMRRACATYEGYGFSRHMGYPTSEHRTALHELGPCPIHRMSFAPLKRLMASESARAA